MDKYRLVSPEHYTAEQKQFVNQFKESILTLSEQTDIVIGAKDIYSRHIISTNAYANIVSLRNGLEVTDRFDKDMPCEGTAQFADCYVEEDRELLSSVDLSKKLSILNVHEYSDGLKARVFCKYLMKHNHSSSILGTIYHAYEIDANNFINIIPNYIMEFGSGCSLEQINHGFKINQINLTEYEQEIGFLILLNWEFKQIADFMNKYHPKEKPRVADSIIKSKNYLCEKIGLASTRITDLRDALVCAGMHRKIPKSIFNRLIGSRRL